MKSLSLNAAWLLCGLAAFIVGIPVQSHAAQPDIIVTEKDNGKDITLHGDQRLIMRFTVPGGTGFFWSALMTPDSLLAFTKSAPPKPKKQKNDDMPMVGGPHDEELAFRAAHFTESSSESFTLIFCRARCDLKSDSTKTFTLGVTTQKK